jgi:hypothetical protein
MASLPISGTEFAQIIARAILKRALSEDETDTALAAAEILINECTGIKHQEEGAEAAEAFEREALIALAKALAQARKGGRSDQ